MKNFVRKTAVLALMVFSSTLVLAQGDAELMLESNLLQANKGDEITVDVKLKNPTVENIISVRTWLEYDPVVLEAMSIDTNNSPFTLSAPGEDTISVSEGRIKIGRSNISGGVSEPEATVATVKFRVLAANALNTEINFYDYQVTELGHTSVNIIDGGFPLNILSDEPEGLTLSLNPGVMTEPVVEPPVVEDPLAPIGNGTVFESGLNRPMNLRANTGSGYIDLIWEADEDPARTGFNIYYGKTSGQYTRRRSIGNTNNYRLDGLTNGEAYYLAVTAYDQFNRESDYSNEVGIIVNQPLSSTHPFEALVTANLANVPMQPQNGPIVWWLAISSSGLALSITFRKKQKLVSVKAD